MCEEDHGHDSDVHHKATWHADHGKKLDESDAGEHGGATRQGRGVGRVEGEDDDDTQRSPSNSRQRPGLKGVSVGS